MNRPSTQAAVVPPSVVILGSDALLAALPATPTQLANACYAAGFEGVFPASWGDELVAAGCLKDLESHLGPAILCTCPLVREQLRGVAPLSRHQVHLVSPPVAAARYLRALCDDAPLRITYVGECPGAEDASIDERVAPAEFLRRLAGKGITPLAQRPDLGSNVPRDRRRFYSLPGGAPTQEWLSADWPKRTLVDADAGTALADLAHSPLARESTLIDFAPQLGCACSGAVGGIAPSEARKSVAALEPPRSRQEVLDPDLKITVQAIVPQVRASREVSWDDFLASLPVTITQPSPTAPPPPPMAGPTAPPPSMITPSEPVEAIPEGPVGRASLAVTPPVRPTPIPPAPPSRTSGPSVRTTQPIPRRAPVVEGVSGPRYLPAPRPVLTNGDRWMLAALVLGCSILSSLVTAFFVARSFEQRTGSERAPSIATVPARDTSVVERRDSVAPPPAITIPAAAPPLGDQRTLAAGAVVPAPASAPKGSVPVKRATPTPPRQGSRTAARPPSPRVVPVAPAAAPLVVHIAPEPASPPPIAQPAATETGAQGSATAAAATVVEPPPAPAPAPAPAAAPAPAKPDSAAAAQNDVAAQLKAIRDELEARKRRVDSLTKAVDSLRKPPR